MFRRSIPIHLVLLLLLFLTTLCEEQENEDVVEFVCSADDAECIEAKKKRDAELFSTSADIADPELSKLEPETTSFTVTFKNWTPEQVRLFWDDGKGGVHQGNVLPENELAINTYQGHKFFFTPLKTKQVLYAVVAQRHEDVVNLYNEEERAKRTAEMEAERQKFYSKYFQDTGRTWQNYWPRDPVGHYQYPVSKIGENFSVSTNQSYFIECPEDLDQTNPPDDLELVLGPGGTFFCRLKENITFTLETQCHDPKVMTIKGVLSDFECQHIIDIGEEIGMKRSTISEAATIDHTRTSKTAWVERATSKVIDGVFRRIADIVQIDESILWLSKSAESLQLVHYNEGEQYYPHHDYGTDRPNNRYITFLMYLNQPEAGGKTSFPNANPECVKEGDDKFAIHPGKGNTIMFYDLFKDGNVDPKTLHAAEPVEKGEKWMINLWIWDPVFT